MSNPADHRTQPDARLAASLLLLRDGAEGALEVLMLRRAERAGDARSGAAVFPGGVLDLRDRQAHGHCLGPDDATASAWLGLGQGGLDYLVAAVRECFEEVGLLLARPGHDNDAEVDPHAHAPWRERLQQGQAGMAEFCAAAGLRLDLREMVYFGHWLTPPGQARRFDTRFFVAPAPPRQQAQADLGEAVALMWLSPAQALDPQRGLKLMPVTQRLLQELSRWGSAAQALDAARARAATPGAITLTMPRRALGRDGPRVLMPDALAYAEVGRLDPEGRGDVLAELRPGVPVQLSPHVWRLTAPNPGPMTGPGTNSYLVGGSAAPGQPPAWTVIDPGPDIAAHVRALQDLAAATGGHFARILVTHTHRDHSPAAASLAAATGAPVWGRLADHPEWQDSSFSPGHQPEHGQCLELLPGLTLRALHTPGHASNHLCWLLHDAQAQERMLFTGDHVMQGSTVVINPPDGDMAAYLQSLQALLQEPLDWLAPGHGFLVAQPHAVLRALIAHRLRRESKVLAALQALAPCGLQSLLQRVYDDVPAALHPVAQRSLLAHLLKLQGEGRAQLRGTDWDTANAG